MAIRSGKTGARGGVDVFCHEETLQGTQLHDSNATNISNNVNGIDACAREKNMLTFSADDEKEHT